MVMGGARVSFALPRCRRLQRRSPADLYAPVVDQTVILLDSRCGFCRRSISRFLAWDRRGRLRPVALQDPEADELLGYMDEERKIASCHLVTADGIYSAGAAFPPLLRLLPGGRPLAWLTATFPGLTERAYRYVARTRGPVR